MLTHWVAVNGRTSSSSYNSSKRQMTVVNRPGFAGGRFT